MREFKGTPGEWRFDDMNMKIKGASDVDFHTVIANVSAKMDYSRGMNTQCYNAKLIAAAPDLLDTIQLAQECYERDKHLLNFDASLLKKAINKALGETEL